MRVADDSLPPSAIRWDGRLLHVDTAPASPCTLLLDGSPFCDMKANADGVAAVELPWSPSGNARLQVRLLTRLDTEIAAGGACTIEIGRGGLGAADCPPLPLRSLAAAERLVPVDVAPMRRNVTVVIPVYNAAVEVRRCLDSVLRHTTGPCRLVVIDDASTQAEIAPLLRGYRGLDRVEILANPRNLGFTATVNRGIELAGRDDVVLLNADTEVGPNWLTGLRHAAFSAADVATATAVSDNAGAFSVPELEHDNPLPTSWTFTEAARALWQSAGHGYPELPTGNGFCLYVRREVFDEVGLFDVEAFPQGYGEENDFCQRASARGWRHLVVGNVFVAHARSRSFGVERRRSLGLAGMRILRERWPRYEADVGATLFSFERRVLDWRVRRIYAGATAWTPRPRLLRVGESGVAGPRSGYDTCMMACTENQWALHGPDGMRLEAVPAEALDEARVADWLQRHAIELVDLDGRVDAHVAGQLEQQCRRLGIAVARVSSATVAPHDRFDAALRALRSFDGCAP